MSAHALGGAPGHDVPGPSGFLQSLRSAWLDACSRADKMRSAAPEARGIL